MRTIALNHVVFKGLVPGIYESRQEAEVQVKDFEGGEYTTYLSTKSARAAWRKHERIAKKIRLSFPIPKQPQILNSVDMRLPTTVTLASDTNFDNGIFTIHINERRFSESLDYSFIPTDTESVIQLKSFYQMLLIAKGSLHLDECREITIYCGSNYVWNICKWAFMWEQNNWLTHSGRVPDNIELVKLMHSLYKELASEVSFRQG